MKTIADYEFAEVVERALERKRMNFSADYGVESKPALIWQCMPARELLLDVATDQLRETLQRGAGDESGIAWWYGFRANQPTVPVFEGYASSTLQNAAGWATELHVDGHLLAGVWSFPELSEKSGQPGPAVLSFYKTAFLHFVSLAAKVYEAASVPGKIFLTCTMQHADKLPLADDRGWIMSEAAKRQTLRWPVLSVENGADFSAAGASMAAQFMRSYGRTST